MRAALAFFAPDRRYACDTSPGGPTRELTAMVDAMHAGEAKYASIFNYPALTWADTTVVYDVLAELPRVFDPRTDPTQLRDLREEDEARVERLHVEDRADLLRRPVPELLRGPVHRVVVGRRQRRPGAGAQQQSGAQPETQQFSVYACHGGILEGTGCGGYFFSGLVSIAFTAALARSRS